ncbi:MAG TPA: chromate efflux transporter [Candidatus Angelobacter sp.]|nr:chromate efflux transporter [Candidatus Angelobacter sp.]
MPTAAEPKGIRHEQRVSLAEIAVVFLKLGTTAFGGPAAHIAMMEDEFVTRRGWLSHQEFLDRLGAANLIPGPSSTEMAIYIGLNKAGWPGLVVAGACFILPAAVLVGLIAAAYLRYGSLPQVAGVLYAVKAVVIAIILQAFWKLAQSAVKNRWLAAIGLLSAVLAFLATSNLLILAIAGALGAAPQLHKRSGTSNRLPGVTWLSSSKVSAGLLAMSAGSIPSLAGLFLTFLKIGSVLFGSGYVLLAFLRSDFVVRLHWLTEKQLLDAVAVGQVTPGPVFTTATFIGSLLGGIPGAVVSTVGIFIPGFILVAISGPIIPHIRRSALASAALDGVIVGSLALMGVVTWQLAKAALVDPITIIIAVVSAILLIAYRINTAWLIAAAAVVGMIVHALPRI